MSITYGPNLGIMSGAADGDLYGDAMRAFQRGVDGLVMPNAKGYLTNTPPGSPADGDLYIIGAAPTGAWAGQGGKVTRWSSLTAAWEFYAPKNGWMIQSNSARETYRYTGGAWEIYYQEGTWTPTATNLGGTSITFPVAKYTKVGNTVHYVLRIAGTNLTSTALSTYVSAPIAASSISVNAADDNNLVGGVTEIDSSRIYLPTLGPTGFINASGDYTV